MRSFLKLALLVAVTVSMFGCAHNYYNIPQETLEKKVKTVGVASLFTDADSDLRHPDKSSLVALIQTFNAKNEKELTARLRSTGTFYSVRPVDGDPNRLFTTLLQNRERREDAGVIYNKYFYKKDEVRRLAAENNLDALLLVVVNGITRPEKVYASNLLSYLETDYNFLAMSAELVDRDGEIIWEYPNFKKSMPLSYPMLLSLQYPDFDEAAANLSDKVDVKFKTIAGITKAFAKTEKSVSNGPPVSTVYADQFDDIISLMKKYQPLFGGKKETAPAAAPTGALEPAHPAAPAPANPAPAAPAAPALQERAPAVQEAPAPAPQGIQEPGMREEIVPETPAK